MHLMTFIEIAQPNWLERLIIAIVQLLFYNAYFFLYLFAPRTAHRVVAYFEEEAVLSYTQYLEEIDAGRHENVPAPQIAIDYWQLKPEANLRDVVIVSFAQFEQEVILRKSPERAVSETSLGRLCSLISRCPICRALILSAV